MSTDQLRRAARVLRDPRRFNTSGIEPLLANWLDIAGADYFAFGDDEHHSPDHEPCDDCDDDPRAPHLRQAVRIARLILGEQS